MSRGSMRLANTEVWGAVESTSTTTINRWKFFPGISGLARMDNIARTFEQWRLVSFRARYESSTGTTQSGDVMMSVDFDPVDLPTTLSDVQTQVPNIHCPVWKCAALSLSPADVKKVNRTTWLYTSAGGATHTGMDEGFGLNVAATGGTTAAMNVGLIFVDYVVEFTNPCNPTHALKQASVAIQSAPVAIPSPISGLPGVMPPEGTSAPMSAASIIDTITSALATIGITPSMIANPRTIPPGYLNSDGSSSPEPSA